MRLGCLKQLSTKVAYFRNVCFNMLHLWSECRNSKEVHFLGSLFLCKLGLLGILHN